MENKKFVIKMTFAILVIALGTVFLLDYLDVCFERASEQWYIGVIAVLAGVSICVSFLYKAPFYCLTAFTLGGIILYLSLSANVENLTYFSAWPLVPAMFGVGMVASNLISKRKGYSLQSGLVIAILSLALMFCIVIGKWEVIVPIVLIVMGILIAVLSIVKIYKKKKVNSDYYIRPSKEKKE